MMKLFLSAMLLGLLNKQGGTETPIWSLTYTVKGTLVVPYAELSEPFQAWYDGFQNLSRIDYYNGMVQTYQIPNDGKYGLAIKIVPETTETVLNRRKCMKMPGSAKKVVHAQGVLPLLNDFSFVTEELVNGYLTEKWQLVEMNGDKRNTYTMWLYYKADPINPNVKMAVPLRYHMKGYNTLFHSHYDLYYFEYISYNPSRISGNPFAISNDLACNFGVGGGGPHESYVYSFNPMAEFIRPEATDHVDDEFTKFVTKHGKKYETHVEHCKRREAFRQNMRFIQSHNRQNKTYKVSVNHLADKTDDELEILRGHHSSGTKNNGAEFTQKDISLVRLPLDLDWRIHGAVTPVKDQTMCGSCWSFSATGAMEGAYFLKTGHLVNFSEQALIDCSWGFNNHGCDGGADHRAFEWILKHGGIPTRFDYGPYLGQDGYCHVNNVTLMGKITSFVNVPPNNEHALRYTLFTYGPVSVSIDASARSFWFYSNGVYYEPNCKSDLHGLNHAVLAVGYGTLRGKNYWLIKNSWSNYWGNGGYILMATANNNCGVMTKPIFVTM